MKNYALNERTFLELSDLNDTIDYLDDNFGGLLTHEDICKYVANRSSSNAESITRCKISLLLAFNEIFSSNSERAFTKAHSLLQRGYGSKNLLSENIEDILNLNFLMSFEQLRNLDINIDFAVANNLLVEVNYIQLTTEEKSVALYALDGYMQNCGPSMQNNLILESIIAKLKNL